LVEQLICNHQVASSKPAVGTKIQQGKSKTYWLRLVSLFSFHDRFLPDVTAVYGRLSGQVSAATGVKLSVSQIFHKYPLFSYIAFIWKSAKIVLSE
jgi:hypothetical protein